MRACRTARRGIFRFKFSYCDATRDFYEFGYKYTTAFLLRRRILQSELCAQNLCKPSCDAEFALRRRFNPAARRFLLCRVKFAPLRNDKIYGAIWRCGGVCSAVRLFCGAGFGVHLFCGGR